MVQRLPGRLVQVRRRGDLDDLLVPALDRAVALEEVDHLALGVGQHLHLDVTGAQDGALDEHAGVAERPLCLAHGGGEGLRETVALVDPAHPAPAPTGDGLDEHGEAHLVRGGEQGVGVVGGVGGLQHGQPRPLGGGDGGDLVAGHLQHLGRRTHERDARLGAGRGQLGVLGQEAVAGVDGVGPALLGDPDDLGHVQVRAHRRATLTDQVGLVRLDPVDAGAVLPREHRDRAGAELGGGPERTDGDLAAVGDQDLGEQRDPRGLRGQADGSARTPSRLAGTRPLDPGPSQACSARCAGNPPVATGPQRVGVTRSRHLPCAVIAARYPSQSGCSCPKDRK